MRKPQPPPRQVPGSPRTRSKGSLDRSAWINSANPFYDPFLLSIVHVVKISATVVTMEAGCWERIRFVVLSKEGNKDVVRWVFIYHRVQAPGVHLHLHSNAISSKHHQQPHWLFDPSPFSSTHVNPIESCVKIRRSKYSEVLCVVGEFVSLRRCGLPLPTHSRDL